MAILEIGRDGHPARNFRNGRFLKGIIPHNKGKKWSEYLDPATAERCLRAGLKNLHGRMDIGGWNKRPVMAILDDGRYFWFESATAAAAATNLNRRNISACCAGKRNRCGRFRWFFFDDENWTRLIKK